MPWKRAACAARTKVPPRPGLEFRAGVGWAPASCKERFCLGKDWDKSHREPHRQSSLHKDTGWKPGEPSLGTPPPPVHDTPPSPPSRHQRRLPVCGNGPETCVALLSGLGLCPVKVGPFEGVGRTGAFVLDLCQCAWRTGLPEGWLLCKPSFPSVACG